MANKSFIHIFLLVIALCCKPTASYAQHQTSSQDLQKTTKEASGKLLNEEEVGETNYSSIINENNANELRLPPLSVLFDNMKNTPRYKMAYNNYKISKSTLSTTKREPLNWINIGASYAYGQFGSQNQTTAESTPITTSVANGVTTSYGMSASIGTTIGKLVDYRSSVKRAKLKTENSKLTFQEQFQVQKLEVMELYNKVESLMNTLSSLAQSETLAAAEYEYAEQEFMSGAENNPNKMAHAKERQNNTKIEFENAKTELNSYLIRLEILTQTQILAK